MTKVQKQQVLESLKKRSGDSGPTQKPDSAIERTKAKAKEILNGSKKSSKGKSDLKKPTGKVVKAEKPKAVLDDSSNDSGMDSSELEESSSDEEDEESDEESDVPVKPSNGKSNGAKAGEASDDDDDEDSDESEDEDEKLAPVAAAGQKRKDAPAEAASTSLKRAKPESTGSTSVFVGNLSWSIDEATLAGIFESIGGVISARIITDRETRRPKGFGYVDFETPEQAEKALELKDTEVDGRAINVDISHGKSAPGAGTPRGGGGGAGGDRTQRYGDNKVSEPSSTLFVGNLSWETTQDALYELFGNSGCQSVRLPTDRETGRPKGFAYVEFSDVASAQSAMTEFQGHYLDNRSLRVDFSQPRSNDGGGFGGRGGGRGGFDRNGGGRGGGRGGFRGGDRNGRGGGRGGFRGGRGAPSFAGKRTTF